MKKITAIIILILALGLVGCKNNVINSGDADSSKTKVEDKVRSDSESAKQESKKQEYKTKLDNIQIGLKDLDKKEASGITADMRVAAAERYKK